MVVGIEGYSAMATVTKADLMDAVRDEVGVTRKEAAALVEGFIETIAERLAAGETVKISSFGTFMVRDKGPPHGPEPEDGRAGAGLAAPGRGLPAVRDPEAAGREGRRLHGGRGIGRTETAML